MEKRPLEELLERAKEAILIPRLAEIAKTSASPNAAYDRALEAGESPRYAKSCRFLAIVARDYGKEEVEKTVSTKQNADVAEQIEKTIARIELLETVAGAKLLIDRLDPIHKSIKWGGKRFADYIQQQITTGVRAVLTLNDWQLKIKISGQWIKKFNGLRYIFDNDFYITNPDGKTGQIYTEGYRNDFDEVAGKDIPTLRIHFLKLLTDHFIGVRCGHPRQERRNKKSEDEPTYISIAPYRFFMQVFCDDLERKGTILPAVPNQFLHERKEGAARWDNPMGLRDVEAVSRLIAEKRTEAVGKSVEPRFLALFDEEARICLEQVSAPMPTAEALDEYSNGGSHFIGREKLESIDRNFVLFCKKECLSRWDAILEKLGYTGTHLQWTTVPEPIFGLFEKCVPEVILLDDHIGYSHKESWAFDWRKKVGDKFGKWPPVFIWKGEDDAVLESKLKAFLDKACPLK